MSSQSGVAGFSCSSTPELRQGHRHVSRKQLHHVHRRPPRPHPLPIMHTSQTHQHRHRNRSKQFRNNRRRPHRHETTCTEAVLADKVLYLCCTHGRPFKAPDKRYSPGTCISDVDMRPGEMHRGVRGEVASVGRVIRRLD